MIKKLPISIKQSSSVRDSFDYFKVSYCYIELNRILILGYALKRKNKKGKTENFTFFSIFRFFLFIFPF